MIQGQLPAAQFKATCKQCDKQMLCIKCHEPLQGYIKLPQKNSSNALLACANCNATYGWTRSPADNSVSITWNNKLIACSGCKGYFKVVKISKPQSVKTTLKAAPIHVLLRET